jgi:Mn2+/Fe2+ NRAMP family transporter
MTKRFVLMGIGMLICLIAALMMFCQERCFLGMDLESWPAVLGIVGIGIIATSNITSVKKKK